MYKMRSLYQEGNSYAELERASVGFECRRNRNVIEFFIFGGSDEFLKVISNKIHKKRISLQIVKYNSAILYVLLFHTHKFRMRTLEYPNQLNEVVDLGSLSKDNVINNCMVKFNVINKETGMVWAIETLSLSDMDAKSLNSLILEVHEKDYKTDDYYKDAQYCQALKNLEKCNDYSYMQVEFI